MVELKVTGFGYTWLEGDYPLAAIAGSFVAVLLSFVLVLRLIGSHVVTESTDETESAPSSAY